MGYRTALFEAFARIGEAPGSANRLELLDLLPQGERSVEVLAAPAELPRRTQDGDITVIDVRPREEYQAGHVPGARSIPVDELPHHLTDLPEDGTVAYCRGPYCVFANDAIRTLTRTAARRCAWRTACSNGAWPSRP